MTPAHCLGLQRTTLVSPRAKYLAMTSPQRKSRAAIPAGENSIQLSLPAWTAEVLPQRGDHYAKLIDRMALALDLARRNIERGTGGPFGAAVFERDSGRLIAIGVNVVVSSACSHAHAEMMALGIAQQRLGTYDLGAEGLPAHELVTSCEPCAMCFGAIPWSGVRRLVCGARSQDAGLIGFDEGPKPEDWVGALQARQIAVERDVLREEARELLRSYRETGGEIYSPRREQPHDGGGPHSS